MNQIKPYPAYFFRLLTSALLLLAACANPVSPTGGPKDNTPPAVLRSDPANQSINFNSDKVIITFSEFVSLKDVSNQLVVSPPLAKQPEFTTRGKNLIMKLKEPLRQNTTYNFFFGNSIVDITENNPLAGYQFTFSTGPVLDSLTLGGKLISAFNQQAVKGAFVMLYDSIYDSIPLKTRPYYLARTGEAGDFQLNNLRDGKYLMFALTDGNADYTYNLPTEDIAFADSLVTPEVAIRKSSKPGDSTSIDSNALQMKKVSSITLRQFREVDSIQKLSKVSLLRENVLSVAFRFPVKKPEIIPVKPALSGNWNVTAFNRTRDTLTIWIPQPESDSLKLIVADSGLCRDTVELALKFREKNIAKGKAKETETKVSLGLKNNIVSSKVKPDQSIVFTFAEPVTRFDTSMVLLKKDSLLLKPDFRFEDSLRIRLMLHHKWEEGSTYQLILPDSTFTGLFGHVNDSIAYRFSAYTESETSNLKLNLTLPLSDKNYIIQLLGDKEKLNEQRVVSENSSVTFSFLRPGKYRIKVVYDFNRNGRWDTGNYLKKRQPEYTGYFSKEFDLRANWTVEEDWNIPAP